ncbi:lysophospholipid acyltransferase family protein [Pseudodesulfovibrio thermohalotolerans]|uniref:lysophospholipid acyltransferase family protein n=1 Tax=Pseudodesulfovibrio thermohalotolerans TaxID=2880651 RepID=UPI002442511D|nr:lysophospholipid acyltransferase family protein [Pseudodesulfovibrio thermohalotolerans]WFS63850.1 lysophospholipid acyltransferase family protein [Pseudodesulfovibrio thermohalotolerans]
MEGRNIPAFHCMNMQRIWVNIFIYGTSCALTVIGLLFSPFVFSWLRFVRSLSSDCSVRKLVWLYGRMWVRLVGLVVPVRMEFASPPTPCVFVANHSSFFDMFFMGAQPEWNICFAVRSWPFRIPWYAPFMRASGYIRTEGSSLEDVLRQSKATLKKGASLLFFPEGTRSTDGEMHRFHSGAFRIALENGVPVVPLCLTGTHALLPKGNMLIQPAKVIVRLLPPVYPDNYRQTACGHLEMKKDVKALMSQALVAMET